MSDGAKAIIRILHAEDVRMARVRSCQARGIRLVWTSAGLDCILSLLLVAMGFCLCRFAIQLVTRHQSRTTLL